MNFKRIILIGLIIVFFSINKDLNNSALAQNNSCDFVLGCCTTDLSDTNCITYCSNKLCDSNCNIDLGCCTTSASDPKCAACKTKICEGPVIPSSKKTSNQKVENHCSESSSPMLTFKPEITIPKSGFTAGIATSLKLTTGPIAQYIVGIYNYGVSIVGILAAIMIMVGGIVWLTAAGSSTKVEQAKEMIGGSLIGLVLVLTSYLLLKTINPNLVNFQETDILSVKNLSYGCCSNNGEATVTNCASCAGNYDENKRPNAAFTECEDEGCCTIANTTPGAADPYSSCIVTTKSNCNESGSTASFDDKKCSEVSGCEKVTSDCEGVEDGGQCKNVMTADAQCYDKKCYYGLGKKGEPCGNRGESRCVDGNFRWQWVSYTHCPENKYSDSGGRDCGSGLYCCNNSTAL